MNQKTLDRFWAKVDRHGPDECWLWIPAKGRGGYRHFFSRHTGWDRLYLIHRFSWEIHFGPIPSGLCVLHHCDRPTCVNPAHLFLGTHADNMADKVVKERQSRGSQRSNAKFTEAQVLQMRERYALGGVTQAQLAREYKVSEPLVRHVVTGATWKHVSTEACGSRHTAKLTEELVLEIRQRYAAGGVTQTQLARKYGVSDSLVCRVVSGERWKHISTENCVAGALT